MTDRKVRAFLEELSEICNKYELTIEYIPKDGAYVTPLNTDIKLVSGKTGVSATSGSISPYPVFLVYVRGGQCFKL